MFVLAPLTCLLRPILHHVHVPVLLVPFDVDPQRPSRRTCKRRKATSSGKKQTLQNQGVMTLVHAKTLTVDLDLDSASWVLGGVHLERGRFAEERLAESEAARQNAARRVLGDHLQFDGRTWIRENGFGPQRTKRPTGCISPAEVLKRDLPWFHTG